MVLPKRPLVLVAVSKEKTQHLHVGATSAFSAGLCLLFNGIENLCKPTVFYADSNVI